MVTYVDKNGYERYSTLIHRQKAYKQIYKKNKDKYTLPFSKYVVHHKDSNKKNNNINNLEILSPEEHDNVHGLNNISSSFITSKRQSIFSNWIIFHGLALIISFFILNYVLYRLDGVIYYLTNIKMIIPLSLFVYFFLMSWWVEKIRRIFRREE